MLSNKQRVRMRAKARVRWRRGVRQEMRGITRSGHAMRALELTMKLVYGPPYREPWWPDDSNPLFRARPLLGMVAKGDEELRFGRAAQ